MIGTSKIVTSSNVAEMLLLRSVSITHVMFFLFSLYFSGFDPNVKVCHDAYTNCIKFRGTHAFKGASILQCISNHQNNFSYFNISCGSHTSLLRQVHFILNTGTFLTVVLITECALVGKIVFPIGKCKKYNMRNALSAIGLQVL